jgi:hypothetical protein
MCKKLIYLVLAFCLASSVHAATIVWVSDNKTPSGGVPADQAWVDLLRAQGHSVDYTNVTVNTGYWNNIDADAAKLAALNAADLIIVSRDLNSGSYTNNATELLRWNTDIKKPVLCLMAHMARSNGTLDRWRWLSTTGQTDATPALQAVKLDHPIFSGVTLNASNQVGILTSNSSISNATSVGNGTLIATRADNGQVWIAEWPTGVEFYSGSGYTTGARRMLFCAGGIGPDGRYNLNADGEKMFLNAVNYLLTLKVLKAYDPDPADGTQNVTVPLLKWTAGETAVYHNVYLGTNPTPGLASEKLTDTYYWAGALTPGDTYYWRIDEVDVDGNIHTGDVWSFKYATLTAYSPSPPDGAKYVSIDVDLSWAAGITGITHDVYFGTNQTDVANGTGGTSKGNQLAKTYEPGTLQKDTVYYWRIDEVEVDKTTKHEGTVWSFRTAPDITIADPNLLCWWKFDEGAGTTAIDWSGHDHHGTLEGDPQWVDGFAGGALQFGGDGDRVVDNAAAVYLNGLGAVTVCMWIKSLSE